MDYYLDPTKPRTRQECEAEGAYYCDSQTPFHAPEDFSGPVNVYHAEAVITQPARQGRREILIVRCRNCGASTGIDRWLLEVGDRSAPGDT